MVEALGKEAVAKMMAQQSTKTLKIYFKAWVRDAMEAFNFMKKKAATFRRKHALPRFFTGWKGKLIPTLFCFGIKDEEIKAIMLGFDSFIFV